MNEKEWLSKAIKFDLGLCKLYHRPVTIEARDQLDGSRACVLKMHEWVLGKDGNFGWEPIPSSRDDEFIKLTRFTSFEECYNFWINNVKEVKPLHI